MLRQYLQKLGVGILYLLMVVSSAPLFGLVTVSMANAVGGETTLLGMFFILGTPVLAAWYLVYRNRLEKETIAYEYMNTRSQSTLLWLFKTPEWRTELLAFLTLIIPVALNIALTEPNIPAGERILFIVFIEVLAGVLFVVMNTLCWVLVFLKWKQIEHKIKRRKREEA